MRNARTVADKERKGKKKKKRRRWFYGQVLIFHLGYAIEVNLIFVPGFSYRNIKKKGNVIMKIKSLKN
jgi:cell division septal protein FtsQ